MHEILDQCIRSLWAHHLPLPSTPSPLPPHVLGQNPLLWPYYIAYIGEVYLQPGNWTFELPHWNVMSLHTSLLPWNCGEKNRETRHEHSGKWGRDISSLFSLNLFYGIQRMALLGREGGTLGNEGGQKVERATPLLPEGGCDHQGKIISFNLWNIARIANAVQCHSQLSGNKDCHEFRFSIVRILMSVLNVTSP